VLGPSEQLGLLHSLAASEDTLGTQKSCVSLSVAALEGALERFGAILAASEDALMSPELEKIIPAAS
jgi:hypothetical protein